jgi:hypothetical protein
MINDKYTKEEIEFYNRVEVLLRSEIADLKIQAGDTARARLALAYDDLARCQALRAALVRIAKATRVDNSGGTGV